MSKIHYFDSFNENKTLCNIKSAKTIVDNEDDITCIKCKQILKNQEISEFRSKNKTKIEKKNLLDEMHSKYPRSIPKTRKHYRNADD